MEPTGSESCCVAEGVAVFIRKLRVALVTTMFYKLIATYRNLYNVAEF